MFKKIYIKIFSIIGITALTLVLTTLMFLFFSDKIPFFNKIIVDKVTKQLFYDYQTAIFDMFEGSYKEFILHNNTPVLLKKLYKGLDDESKEKLDITLNAILHVPDSKYMKYFYFNSIKFNNDFRAKLDTFRLNSSYQGAMQLAKIKYKLPSDAEYIPGVFIDKHNLRYAPEKLKEYIKDKIFIDIGAYVGDSVLVLLEYKPSLIYSFEISDMNIRRFNETMKMNNVPMEKVKLVNLAIAEGVSDYKIAGQWEMEGIESVYEVTEGQTVKSTDLDSFMKDKKGKVGFIKGDVQGIMHKAVKGMKATIRRDRPVLLLDISDSPQDFFYTKPILENILKGLNYTIKITNFDSSYGIIGTSIYAYPKELDE